jgi:hypothetical protein
MPFCWMDENDAQEAKGNEQSRKAATTSELRERAALMRRLGYSKSDAVHRCMGNLAWAFSVSGQPAVTPAMVRKIVSEVYGKAS